MLFNLFKVGVVFACLSVVPRAAVGADAADPWTAFRFLLGEWEGEGTGQPGKGSDGFSFAFDLDRKILVRKNRNDIPATATHPATAHQDLMVIYREEPAKPTRAIYFDNAGHVIRYAATPAEDGKRVEFISNPEPGRPRFRLTYSAQNESTVKIRFEVAPPGRPDNFKTYVEGTCRRKGSPGR